VLVSSVFGDRVGEASRSATTWKGRHQPQARFYAVSLGRKGIRVNVSDAFYVPQEESKDFYLNNKNCTRSPGDGPIGRMGRRRTAPTRSPFLCSPAASFINGQNLYVERRFIRRLAETLARKLKSI